MGEDKSTLSLIPISGGLAVVAALGLMLYGSQPFKADRPAAPDHPERHTRVSARLWQDPFQAVLDGSKAPGRKLDPCHINLSEPARGQVCQVVAPVGRLSVLGVMVPGGPYAENAEMRLRYRYAVLSGFARLGYYPEDAEHINFLKIDTGGGDTQARYSLTNIMPFEWLWNDRPGEEGNRILVLWMSSAVFEDDPLRRIERLAALFGIPRGSPGREFKIIGPAESDTLKRMVKEAQAHAVRVPGGSKDPPGYEIYSTVATVDDRVLLRDVKCGPESTPQSCGRAREMSERDAVQQIRGMFRARGFELVRTTGTDRNLARALIQELALRGVDLTDEKTRVLLVAEWDTYYGRSIEEHFREELVEMLTPAHPEKETRQEKANRVRTANERILRISYLRGIDGRLPGGEEEEKKKDQQKKDRDETKDDASKEKENWERPVGRSQLDYLRRLSEGIERVSVNSRRAGEGEIRAVGVIGTDFYDKFLALQALRQKFFDAVYFTVDMDARYLHRDQIEWTRNLVVASNFDFSLRKDHRVDLQGEIPPFRDTYQTSVFYAILSIFARDLCRQNASGKCEDGRRRLEQFVPGPLVFEVGRSKAALLTDPGDSVHPMRNLSYLDSWRAILYTCLRVGMVLLIAVLGLVFLFITSTGLNRFAQWFRKGHRIWIGVGMALFVVMVALTVSFISRSEAEEPFSFLEGISVWPTEMFLFVAAVMSWVFFALAYRDRKENTRDTAEKFKLGEEASVALTWKAFRAYTVNHLYPRTWTRQKSREWLAGILDLDWRPEVSEGADLRTLWRKYRDHDKGITGFWRVAIMAALATALTYLILWLDFPVTPARGHITRGVDLVMGGVFIVSFLVLMCYVYDVTRCCRRFISIASDVFEGKPKPKDHTDMNARIVEELSLIRLIANRSAAIGKFIFYPFIVWLIMLVSRTSYIDNWRMPLSLAVVISLGAVYVWGSAVLMRMKGEKARELAIGRLKGLLSDTVLTKNSPASVRQQLSFAIQEIRSIREGAFAPLSQQPVLRVLLVPFGGLGGIYWLEYLMRLNQ